MDIDERYKRGKIYRLACTSTLDIYYGSTIQTLNDRLIDHRKSSNSCESKNFVDPVIELIEDYPCNNKRELEKKEQYYIDNNECINKIKSYVSEEDRIENNKKYCKKYHQDNREKQNEKRKKYREENKEKIKEYARQYNQEKVVCECGAEITKINLSKHKRRKIHKKNLIDNINENL